MNFSKKIIATAVLMVTSSMALAVTDTTEIEINVTRDAFVNFIGGLSGNTAIPLNEADVNANTVVLGQLGTESNTVGGCGISISSLNDFRFQHDVDATLFLHGTNSYTVDYVGGTFTSGAAPTVNLPSCNNAETSLSIISPALVGVVQAGIYSDVITVTVETQ